MNSPAFIAGNLDCKKKLVKKNNLIILGSGVEFVESSPHEARTKLVPSIPGTVK